LDVVVVLAAVAVIVAVAAWLYPRRPRGEGALRKQERRGQQLEVYGTLQQICETIERMAPRPMGTVVGVYAGAEGRLSDFERNALWNKGALPSFRVFGELDEIERLMKEKRALLEDSTVEAWRNVWRRDGYGSGGGPTGVYHELELMSFRKFTADVAANYTLLRRQVGT
jgi:hypothetical protein